MGDCNYLVADAVAAFRETLLEVLAKPYAEIAQMACIGSLGKVQEQLKLVELCASLSPKDAMDVWKYAGNQNPEGLLDMPLDEFLRKVRRLNNIC
jgi:malonate decarboxylase beta subunit